MSTCVYLGISSTCTLSFTLFVIANGRTASSSLKQRHVSGRSPSINCLDLFKWEFQTFYIVWGTFCILCFSFQILLFLGLLLQQTLKLPVGTRACIVNTQMFSSFFEELSPICSVYFYLALESINSGDSRDLDIQDFVGKWDLLFSSPACTILLFRTRVLV